MDTEQQWKDGVIQRITALEQGQAVAAVHHSNVEKRLGSIEDTLKWIVRLLIGAIMLAFITFAMQGGLIIGK